MGLFWACVCVGTCIYFFFLSTDGYGRRAFAMNRKRIPQTHTSTLDYSRNDLSIYVVFGAYDF